MSGADQPAMREALKRTAVALKQAGITFALGGGYAAWARGGPESEHDVDFLVTEADAEKAAQALAGAGLDVVEPPEDWLFKVHTDGVVVDVIFRAGQASVDPGMLARAEQLEVCSVEMPVMEATDLLASKLRALSEHQCDFTKLLPVARAVREQVDWGRLREQVACNDFAVAFLVLLDRLAISASAQPLPASSRPVSP
jgi:Uncharacterised nucleotidyltransferase